MAQGLQYARQLPCRPLAHVPSSKSDHQWNADPRLGINGRVPVAAAILLASDGCREAGQAEAQTRKRQLEASVFGLQVLPDPGDPLLVVGAMLLHACPQQIRGREVHELPPEEGLDATFEEPEAHDHRPFLRTKTPALHIESHVGDQGLPAVPSCGEAAGAADNASPMLHHARCSIDERAEAVWNHPFSVQLLQPSPLRDNGWGGSRERVEIHIPRVVAYGNPHYQFRSVRGSVEPLERPLRCLCRCHPPPDSG